MIFDSDNTLAADKERVPCPLDPNHTVFIKDMKIHLQKCNSKPKEVQEPWFKHKINLKIGEEDVVEESDEDKGLTEEQLFEKYISRLEDQVTEPLQKHVSQHSGLDPRLAELTHKKHPLQQSSLIGNLKERNLLGLDYFYLEYGCGRGELSRTLNLCLLGDRKAEADNTAKEADNNEKEGLLNEVTNTQNPEDSVTSEKPSNTETTGYGFGLVDRGVTRRKFDTRIAKDCQLFGLTPPIRRSRIDIQDLSVDDFIGDLAVKKMVAISKHLCGAATDLTLKLIINSSVWEKDQFGGLLIAMCCRHVCQYDQLLPQSREYLKERGFGTRESFKVLKKVVSWAVSGTETEETDESDKKEELGQLEQEIEKEKETTQLQQETQLNETQLKTQLGQAEERLGLMARRLIDDSRVYAMKQLLPPRFTAEMFLYTDKEVTLENSCLCILQNPL